MRPGYQVYAWVGGLLILEAAGLAVICGMPPSGWVIMVVLGLVLIGMSTATPEGRS